MEGKQASRMSEPRPRSGRSRAMDEQIPDEMDEPVPCEECGEWVELDRTRKCRGCGQLMCRDCLEEGYCVNCREE